MSKNYSDDVGIPRAVSVLFGEYQCLVICQEVSDCECLCHVMMWMCVDCTSVCAASLDGCLVRVTSST